MPLSQRQADPAIAAQIAGCRQHQVAQARQAGKRFGTCTQRQTQTCHFRQTTGDQCGTCVQAQLQAITQAGGNGQHIFDGSTHFHANDVIVGINTQRGAVKSGHQRLAHSSMCTGGHQRSGLAARHFQRKAGAAEHARF